MKREVREGFEKTEQESKAAFEEQIALESRVIAEVERIISLLDARKGAWVIQDGQLLFADQGDVAAHSSHIAKIQEITAKQEAIQQRGKERMREHISRMKN
jgi:hypothetical protein